MHDKASSTQSSTKSIRWDKSRRKPRISTKNTHKSIKRSPQKPKPLEKALDVSEKEKPPEEPKIWQQRVKRQVGIDRDKKVPVEVLVLPEVRPDIIALAVSQGIATQKYVERMIVDAVNKNPELVEKGEEYIKRANGNVRRAIILSQQDIADRLHDLETAAAPSSPQR